MQEPGIGPKLVLSEACPELAVALSVVEGMAEWVEWILNKTNEQNPNVLPKGRLTVKTGGPSACVCCLLSFEVWICLELRI